MTSLINFLFYGITQEITASHNYKLWWTSRDINFRSQKPYYIITEALCSDLYLYFCTYCILFRYVSPYFQKPRVEIFVFIILIHHQYFFSLLVCFYFFSILGVFVQCIISKYIFNSSYSVHEYAFNLMALRNSMNFVFLDYSTIITSNEFKYVYVIKF